MREGWLERCLPSNLWENILPHKFLEKNTYRHQIVYSQLAICSLIDHNRRKVDVAKILTKCTCLKRKTSKQDS